MKRIGIMRNRDQEVERLNQIIQMIRPLPESVRPSETFVRDTRMLLEHPGPASLAEYRQRKDAEDQARSGGNSAAA